MLALASLRLATLSSVAVVGWMPRPAPPPERLDHAMQELRGNRRRVTGIAQGDAGPRPPQGSASDWLAQLAAAQMGMPAEDVRLAWTGAGQGAHVQVIEVARYWTPPVVLAC